MTLQHQVLPDGSAQFDTIDTPEDERGQGLGTRCVQDAKRVSDQTGLPHSWTKVTNPDFFNAFDHLTPEFHPRTGRGTYSYRPRMTLSRAGLCPSCGDRLQGEHGTFCPRCDWSENNANLDSDPLSNPPDPTVDMHRGIQARIAPSHRWARWLAAVEDLD